jgi:hypothetical protein
MPSEHSERTHTQHALDEVFDYIRPGTNEGISFSLSRLTQDLFTDSFLAGGDISLFSASGKRGTIKSQLSNGWLLSPDGGAPAQFPIDLQVDLNAGSASGTWTLPNGSNQTPHFQLQHVRTSTQPEGKLIAFSGETSSDEAVYSLALLLI